MKKQFFALFWVLSLSGLFGGCAVHQVYYVTQPAQAQPGSQISVYVFTAMGLIDTTRNIGFEAGTDSVLISAALPSGWSVVSAEYFVDPDVYHHFKLDSSLFDSANARRIFDSLKIAGDVVTASRAAQYDAALDGRYDSANVRDQFISFLGLRGFHVPAGTPADTTMMYNDTLYYIKLIASCSRFVLACGGAEGSFNLGYFTGYKPNDLYGADIYRQFNAYNGSVLIRIADSISVEKSFSGNVRGLRLLALPNPSPRAPEIAYCLPSGVPATLSLFDPNGRALWARHLPAGGGDSGGWNSLPWLEGERMLSNGTYVLRLEAAGRSVSKTFVIAR